MEKPGHELRSDSKMLLGRSSAYPSSHGPRAGGRAGTPANRQITELGERRERPRERLFELRSNLTIETLRAACGRQRPAAVATLPSGRTVSGHVDYHVEEGLSFWSQARVASASCQLR